MKSIFLFLAFLLLVNQPFSSETTSSTAPKLYSDYVKALKMKLTQLYPDSIDQKHWLYLDTIQTQLPGTRMDDFQFVDVYGNSIDLGQIDQPILLEASASWCGPCIAALPALNDFAEQYRDSIQILIVLQDHGERAVKFANKFNTIIKVIASDHSTDPMGFVKAEAGDFQHLLPFPTGYYLDKNKLLQELKLGGPSIGTFNLQDTSITVTEEMAYQQNMTMLRGGFDRIKD